MTGYRKVAGLFLWRWCGENELQITRYNYKLGKTVDAQWASLRGAGGERMADGHPYGVHGSKAGDQ